MPDRGSKAEDILDAAESMARSNGYNGFSFRDLASAVGIKSASVHYHFPTKGDLGVAVARRYTERFVAALGDPGDPETTPEVLLERYIDAFRRALAVDGQMCLCGMLGAEIASLPVEVADEARRFFELNLDWLETALSPRGPAARPGHADTRSRALGILATLEGAVILSRSLGELAVFEQIAARIRRWEGN